jgi:biotin transporter BioY
MNIGALAWGISIVIGGLVTPLVTTALHAFVAKLPRSPDAPEATRITWMPAVVGVVERTLYTLLVGYNVSGAAGFIGAWITIKAVGGWARWSQDRSDWARALFTTGLLGSAISALFGVWSGLLIASKAADPATARLMLWLVLAVLIVSTVGHVIIRRVQPEQPVAKAAPPN